MREPEKNVTWCYNQIMIYVLVIQISQMYVFFIMFYCFQPKYDHVIFEIGDKPSKYNFS